MSSENRFNERYRTGDTPWDTGKPDRNLIEIVAHWPVEPCKVLEVGCGTGDCAIWLAGHNFQVTGVETSEIAIERARAKAAEAGVKCSFVLGDFLEKPVEQNSFGFVFDRGCFHSFDTEADRERFAANAAACLTEDGLWLSLIGSADQPDRDHGPPQRTALDIVRAVEPCLEILSLTTCHFDSQRTDPPKAWICLMGKRRENR